MTLLPLLEQLRSDDPVARKMAVLRLVEAGSQAAPPLVRLLSDENRYVRRHAAEALGCIGDRRAVEALIVASMDSDEDVSFEADRALRRISRPSIDPLLEALADEDPSARRYAATALGYTGESSAVAPLVEALRDGDEQVRNNAADSLRKLTNEVLGASYDEWQDWLKRERSK